MVPPPKISIIIPVYNAEISLEASLKSAIQQTLKDIEIICVDNCSTDSSHNILLKYKNSDKRVRLIKHDKNIGVSAAKNTGINEAIGDYIFHLDPKDTIPLNALELLYTQAKKYDSELVKGRYNLLHEGGEIEHLNWSTPDSKVINTNIYTSKFLQKIPTSYHAYIYNRKFLNSYNIRHRTDLTDGDDIVTIATALKHAKTVTLIPEIVYFCYQSRIPSKRGRISVTEAQDAIKAKTIVADILNKLELHTAATSYLQSWDFIIHTQWLRMPLCLTTEECIQVFTDFRSLFDTKRIVPWAVDTAHHHRHILALVLAKHDEEALSFLRTHDASNGFSSQTELINSLMFIQAQYPDDAENLSALALIAQSNGELKKALHLFNEAIKYESGSYNAHVQSAILLKDLGRTDEAHNRLNTALEIITKNSQFHDIIKRILTLKEEITHMEESAELNNLNIELEHINKELSSLYTSKSWQITKPLRNVDSVFKRIKFHLM